MPPITAIDPIKLRPALGRILIIEPVDQGRDFRYRLFGTHIAAVSGYDMTGKLLSVHPMPLEVICFAFALYRNLLARPEPVMTVNTPPSAPFSRWERLVLPFGGADGEVVRFVVGNVGFDREGRELRV
ncbi:MAG: PAS domain-containing protein [Aliidongia sp.]